MNEKTTGRSNRWMLLSFTVGFVLVAGLFDLWVWHDATKRPASIEYFDYFYSALWGGIPGGLIAIAMTGAARSSIKAGWWKQG